MRMCECEKERKKDGKREPQHRCRERTKILRKKFSYNSYALALCSLPFFFHFFSTLYSFFPFIYFRSFPFSLSFFHSLLVSLIFFFLHFSLMEHTATQTDSCRYTCVSFVVNTIYIHYTHIIPLCRRCS